jgi:hypothetical protein
MLAAPVKVESTIQSLPAELPINCDFVKSLQLHYAAAVSPAERPLLKFLGEAKELVNVDFRTVETAPSFSDLSLSWHSNNISEINAFILLNNSTFTDETKMDNFTSQSWAANVYEFDPFADSHGQIKFALKMDEKKSIWTISLPSNSAEKPKTYSPAFAVTQAKMVQQMTPYRKFNPQQKPKG